MKYKVNLSKTDEDFSIWVPGLPGCWSQEEALENIKDAIQGDLEAVEEISKDKISKYFEINTKQFCNQRV